MKDGQTVKDALSEAVLIAEYSEVERIISKLVAAAYEDGFKKGQEAAEPAPSETYRFATATGDTAFLTFLHQRLIHHYGEDENTDFVLTLKAFVDGFSQLVNNYEYDR